MRFVNFKDKKVFVYLIPVLIVIFTIIYCFGRAVWLDEVFSLKLASNGFGDILCIDSTDVHPPLYYFLLRIGFITGDMLNINSIVVGKFVSVLAEIILLFVAIIKVNKKWGRNVSIIFSIFLVSMPQMTEYFTEVRMYGWGALFVICAFIYGMEIVQEIDNRKAYILLSLFAILSAYTHYYALMGCFLIYVEVIVLLFMKGRQDEIKKVFFSGIIVAVSFLPWIFVLMGQVNKVNDNYWIAPITINSIKDNLHFIIAENEFKIAKAVIILIILIGIVGIIVLKKNKDNSCYLYEACCSGMVLIGTIILGIIISLVFRPIFVSRYMFCSLPCFWLAVAIGISEIIRSFSKFRIVVGIIVLCILFSSIHTSYAFFSRERERQREVDAVLTKINEIADEETVIVSNSKMINIQLAYYYPDKQFLNVGEIPVVYKKIFKKNNLDEADIEDIKKYKNIIICDCDDGLTELISSKLAEPGRKLKDIGDYYYYYWHFNMYYMK